MEHHYAEHVPGCAMCTVEAALAELMAGLVGIEAAPYAVVGFSLAAAIAMKHPEWMVFYGRVNEHVSEPGAAGDSADEIVASLPVVEVA